VRLQTQNLLILQAVTETFEPAAFSELVNLTNALTRAGQRDRATVASAAKALLDWVEKRDPLSRRQFSAADVTSMRKTLIKYGATDKAGDFAAAEQIVLGMESLSYSLGDHDKKKAALDALYKTVTNDTTFSPQEFARVAASAQRSF
jgi:hypothetical protein